MKLYKLKRTFEEITAGNSVLRRYQAHVKLIPLLPHALVMLAAACAAALLVYTSIPFGMGTSFDSVSYVQSAEHFMVSWIVPKSGLWPPTYSMLLGAWACFASSAPYSSAPSLSLLLLLIQITIILGIAWQANGHKMGGALIALGFFLGSRSVFAVHTNVTSEQLFGVLILAAVLLAVTAEKYDAPISLVVLLGIVLGLSFVTKYSAPPVIVAIAAVFLVRVRRNGRFILSSIILVLLSLAPYLLWISYSSSSGNLWKWQFNILDSMLFAVKVAYHSSVSVGQWFLPESLPDYVKSFSVSAVAIAALARCAFSARMSSEERDCASQSISSSMTYGIAIMTFFWLFFVIHYGILVRVLEANDRTLYPVMIGFTVAVIPTTQRLVDKIQKRFASWPAVTLMIVTSLVLFSSARTFTWAQRCSIQGAGGGGNC